MEHVVDFVCFAPMVQMLDAPVPQTVEQLPDILRFFDTLMPDRGRLHAHCCAGAAAGGTVGGSADSRVSFLAGRREG